MVSCSVQKTGGVVIYLYVCVCLLVLVCPVCVCLCVISNQSTSKNHVIRFKPLVNLMPFCIKHTARCCWYKGTKA